MNLTELTSTDEIYDESLFAAEHKGAIEAILFAGGDPVPADRLAAVINLPPIQIKEYADSLAEEYDSRGSGIRILRLGDSYQMCTREKYADYIKAALDIRRNARLSQAAVEVLAIIAYNQPVTKAFIEQVRGVDCSGVVNTLVEKELIEEAGRLELPGRPIAYKTGCNFLRCFSLGSIEELPSVESARETEEAEQEENLFGLMEGAAPENSEGGGT